MKKILLLLMLGFSSPVLFGQDAKDIENCYKNVEYLENQILEIVNYKDEFVDNTYLKKDYELYKKNMMLQFENYQIKNIGAGRGGQLAKCLFFRQIRVSYNDIIESTSFSEKIPLKELEF